MNQVPSELATKRVSARERSARNEDVFHAVQRAYIAAKQASPVVAFNIDPDATSHSERRIPEMIHFAVDVELITERLLKTPEEQQTWFALALGMPTEREMANNVIQRCGNAYAARHLEPWIYYRSNRYPHRGTSK